MIKVAFQVSQGSVATQLMYGAKHDWGFIANLLLNPNMTKFWKSADIWKSYDEKYHWSFLTHSILLQTVNYFRNSAWIFGRKIQNQSTATIMHFVQWVRFYCRTLYNESHSSDCCYFDVWLNLWWWFASSECVWLSRVGGVAKTILIIYDISGGIFRNIKTTWTLQWCDKQISSQRDLAANVELLRLTGHGKWKSRLFIHSDKMKS